MLWIDPAVEKLTEVAMLVEEPVATSFHEYKNTCLMHFTIL